MKRLVISKCNANRFYYFREFSYLIDITYALLTTNYQLLILDLPLPAHHLFLSASFFLFLTLFPFFALSRISFRLGISDFIFLLLLSFLEKLFNRLFSFFFQATTSFKISSVQKSRQAQVFILFSF